LLRPNEHKDLARPLDYYQYKLKSIMLRLVITIFTLLAFKSAVHASCLPYTHIVVGAGTAGSITAARISEDPTTCVLLISNAGNVSGSDGTGVNFCQSDPTTFPPNLPSMQAEMGYSLETYPGTAFQQPYILKNKADGGATAYNTGVTNRLDRRYWDELLAISPQFAAAGWDSETMHLVWNKMETYKPGPGFPTDPATMRWHGTNGPMVLQTWDMEPASAMVAQCMAEVVGIPQLLDTNIGIVEGVGVVPRTIDTAPDGSYVRQTSFEKYIRVPNLWNPEGTGTRHNLNVWEYTTVTKLLFRPATSVLSKPVAYGVQYQSPEGAGTVSVRPGGRIILSAGTPSSIILLQTSGVGDCVNHLSQLAPAGTVPCIYNNPAVGNNNVLNSIELATQYMIRTPTIRSGCQTTNGYWRSQRAQAAGEQLTDIGFGWGIVWNTTWPTDPTDPTKYPFFLSLPLLYRSAGFPSGTFGHVFAKDADPSTPPDTSFNIDPTTLLEAFQKQRAAFACVQSTFGIETLEVNPGLAAVPNDPVAMAAWIAGAFTIDFAHGFGGAPMGATDSHGAPLNGAVLDARLRVIGVTGLSVADNSVWPIALSSHVHASSALTVGEKAAELALQDWHDSR